MPEPETARTLPRPTAVLDALQARIAVLDLHGVIVSVNQSWHDFAAASGLSAGEFGVGHRHTTLCCPHGSSGNPDADAHPAAVAIATVLSGVAAEASLDYGCDVSGSSRWFCMSVTPLHGPDGRGAVVVHVDITERKRAETALRDSAHLLRAVASGTTDAIFVKDTKGRYLFCNDAVARFAGSTVEALIGQDDTQAFGSESAKAVLEDDRRVMTSGEVLNTETLLTGTGGARTYRAIKAPYRNAQGEVIGVLGISRDVTEHHRVQHQCGELAERLSSTLENLSDGFCTLDSEWRFTYVNRKAERMLGRPRGASLGQVLWHRVPQFAGTLFETALRRAMSVRAAEQLVECFVPRNRWYELRILPSEQGLAVYIRDISREHRLSVELATERARLVAAQAVARIGSWSIDLATTQMEWSDETHRIFETDPRCFKPDYASFRELVHPGDRIALDTRFTATLSEERTQAVEHRVLLSSGLDKVVEERWDVFRNEAGLAVRAFGTCQDITERKRIEQALHDSQVLRGIAGRLAQVGGWSLSVPGGRVVWSEVLAAIHDEPDGHSSTLDEALAYYVPEHRDRMRRVFEHCVSEGVSFDVERQIVTATGRRIWVRVIGEAVRDAAGVIERVQGALQDVTQLKTAEQESRLLAQRLSNIMQSISEGYFTVDREWRFTYVNAEAERLLMRRRDELLGQVMWEAFAPSLGTEFEQQYRRAVADNCKVNFEAWYAPLNAWERVTAYPSKEGLAVYFRDVTEERAARRQLELLQASVARLNDMVIITEAEPLDDPGPRMVFVNEAFVRSTGHARADVIGRPPRMLLGPMTDRNEVRGVRAALEQQQPIHAELLLYKKSGEPYWAELDIMPVGLDGASISHFVAVKRDISERKRDQEALRELNAELENRVLARTSELNRARDEAEQANRAKSLFLTTMSHEIRTPMNGVIGMIDVLHQTSLQPDQLEMVGLIRDSADSLLGIVEDILDFSGIEAGKLQIDAQPMQLRAVVERTCGLLGAMASRQGVTLSAWVDPALPRSVVGDAMRLRQVLVNVAGNAIKFSGGLGRPGVVAVRATLVSRQPQAVTVDLSVTDNGIGIDAASLARLFTPFTQADTSTTRRFGGTGLGLAISSTLVRLMGGEISVHSALDQGAVFTVRLSFATHDGAQDVAPDPGVDNAATAPPAAAPVLVPDAPLPAPIPQRGRPAGDKLILVAEDNVTNRKVIMLQLQLIGFPAEVVVNGAEALERWRGGQHALLLTDLHMPEMDGYALARAIRAQETAEGRDRMPIIAVTANAMRDEATRCTAAGMDGHMTKPVRLGQLKAAIETWLGPAQDHTLRQDSAVDSGAASDVVDLQVLVALIGDDPLAIADVLNSFRKSAAQSGAAIVRGLASGLRQDATAAAHKLKSGARAIGAKRLAELCEAIETLPAVASLGPPDGLASAFETELRAVFSFLDAR